MLSRKGIVIFVTDTRNIICKNVKILIIIHVQAITRNAIDGYN